MTTLIVSGSSLSACPWITWKDLLIESMRPGRVIDLTVKGAGNTYIIHSILSAVRHLDSSDIVVAAMFTSMDKFDWWMSGDTLQKHLLEKHPPVGLDGKPATDRGFWGTGSWFPGQKQLYKDHFYDIDWQISQFWVQYHCMKSLCKDRGIKLMTLADSPIFEVTEQELNVCAADSSKWKKLDKKDQVLTNSLGIACMEDFIDTGGILGFAHGNGLPAWHEKYKTHPPSGVHLKYFQQVISPWASNQGGITLGEIDSTTEKIISRMDKNWHSGEF